MWLFNIYAEGARIGGFNTSDKHFTVRDFMFVILAILLAPVILPLSILIVLLRGD
jgi:hypothetical protein